MRSIEDLNPIIRSYYVQGQRNERVVMEWLLNLGYEVRRSSLDEDYKLDIDLWIRKRGTNTWLSVSVKTNEPKYFHSPFVFELTKTKHGHTTPSWYNTGCAMMYIIWKRNNTGGGELYAIKKNELQQYVDRNGWDRETGLTAAVSKREMLNNCQSQAGLGLLYKGDGVKRGLAQLLDTKKTLLIKRDV